MGTSCPKIKVSLVWLLEISDTEIDCAEEQIGRINTEGEWAHLFQGPFAGSILG